MPQEEEEEEEEEEIEEEEEVLPSIKTVWELGITSPYIYIYTHLQHLQSHTDDINCTHHHQSHSKSLNENNDRS